MNLFYSPKKIARVLATIVIVLTLLSLIGQFYKYFFFDGQDRYIVNLFNLDKELNFPTWYAALSLIFCSFLLFIISSAKKKSNDSYYRHWVFLSAIFFLLASDEMIQLHEQVITPIRNILNTTGYLYITWVIPAIIFGVIFLVAYYKFLLHLPRYYMFLFIISGTVYILGAIGLEIIGSNHIYFYGQNNLSYSLLTTLEEVLEMTGILFFIFTITSYISTELADLQISVKENK